MWLETLTLQTHESSKPAIQQIYRDICVDRCFQKVEVSIFYHESSILYVTCHLRHLNEIASEYSAQAAKMLGLFEKLGPVHHRSWLPLQ